MHKILVVDDEPYMLALLRMTLEKLECQILLASDGKKALNIASSEKPDLILLDWLLPDMDGLEVCRLLKGKEDTRRAKILVLTAKVGPSEPEAAALAGADGYLTKPFSPKELVATVATALGVGQS